MRSASLSAAALMLLVLACSRPIPPKPTPAPAPPPTVASEPVEPARHASERRARKRSSAGTRRASDAPSDLERSAEPEAESEPAPLAEAAPAVARSNRCITGTVRARGSIVVPVKNATVTFFKGPALLGETRTDGNGKFAWCAGPNLAGRFEVTVRVRKEPFQTISQSRDWRVGTQEEFDFAMVAEEF